MRILEQFTASRSPERPNEDRYTITADFVAVIDGAGDSLRRSWRGHSGGWHAAEALSRGVSSLQSDADASSGINHLTMVLRELHRQMEADLFGPPYPAANIVMYSRLRRQIWRVGDCSFSVNEQEHKSPPKKFEQVLIDVRRLILLAGLGSGVPIERLDADVRSMHEVLHRYQDACQNSSPRHAFSFPVLDGRDVAISDIEVVDIGPDAYEIVLASDGYPVIKESLEESEKQLAQTLSLDPFLVGDFAQAKAPTEEGTSFDDRTYVRIDVGRRPS